MDRVCRIATCAETRAMIDCEGELFALRYQWLEMLGNSAREISLDEMAWLAPGACVTDSEGLYDKVQHTVITPTSLERRNDIECLALKEGLESSSKRSAAWEQPCPRHRSGASRILSEEWTTLEDYFRHAVNLCLRRKECGWNQ